MGRRKSNVILRALSCLKHQAGSSVRSLSKLLGCRAPRGSIKKLARKKRISRGNSVGFKLASRSISSSKHLESKRKKKKKNDHHRRRKRSRKSEQHDHKLKRRRRRRRRRRRKQKGRGSRGKWGLL
ncbi:protamine-like [Selaginella moellendorffii]|uniref:protamine-like n=1 Tax=Selaginella moellendorffii TaxID=88036 RepID=UPI000D1C3E8B|nr:protamine-like [Selaginella moellendorffii]|eukprot:XP_024517289.1 protamine-like [Selaginella moellendorffii]